MAKKQPKSDDKPRRSGVRAAVRNLARMVTLTRQEQALILCLVLSLLVGAAVQHWRRTHREKPVPAAPPPSSRAAAPPASRATPNAARESAEDR